jgi:hypothetical protein
MYDNQTGFLQGNMENNKKGGIYQTKQHVLPINPALLILVLEDVTFVHSK